MVEAAGIVIGIASILVPIFIYLHKLRQEKMKELKEEYEEKVKDLEKALQKELHIITQKMNELNNTLKDEIEQGKKLDIQFTHFKESQLMLANSLRGDLETMSTLLQTAFNGMMDNFKTVARLENDLGRLRDARHRVGGDIIFRYEEAMDITERDIAEISPEIYQDTKKLMGEIRSRLSEITSRLKNIENRMKNDNDYKEGI